MPEYQIRLNWGDLVAIYAAVISTVVGIIEIFRFRREIKSKIVVKFAISSQAVGYANGVVGEWTLMINMLIVNHSVSERYINQPGIQINKGEKIFSVLVQPLITYPKRLSSGEAFDISYDARTIKETVLKANASKVRAIISDTLGNRYYSNWLVVNDIHPYE